MNRTSAAVLFLVLALASSAAAAEVRGVGGPETLKPDPKKIVPLRGDAARADRAVQRKSLPKGMLRPGQGPFPNLPNPKAEGGRAQSLKAAN